jgi:hypothetical protein
MTSIQAHNVNHPDYQENLNETKYTIIRDAILAVLPDKNNRSGLSFAELEEKVSAYLSNQSVPRELFPKPGSVRWYTKAVQLDLEAREMIERVPNQTPIHLRKII